MMASIHEMGSPHSVRVAGTTFERFSTLPAVDQGQALQLFADAAFTKIMRGPEEHAAEALERLRCIGIWSRALQSMGDHQAAA